ncbi:MAG: phosphoribosylaminoimidazolesuccinocarboxamide synthase [Clostridiales bacterium]|nr:phosphoribosylaminoimidazolesuccinocarboxamide synthase [Clostridiales bacterium]
MIPERLDLLHRGKAKDVYRTSSEGLLWVHFRDDLTAGDGAKKGREEGKGTAAGLISAYLFGYLAERGIPTHQVEVVGPRDVVVKALTMVPVEVVVRQVAAGSLVKRLGLPPGEILPRPLVEWYYKRDDLGDPLLAEDHVLLLNLLTRVEMETLRTMALRIFRLLAQRFWKAGLLLVDMKLEFGRHPEEGFLLADEISPDTCRLWDQATGASLDKDLFRKGLSPIVPAYREVLRRLGLEA